MKIKFTLLLLFVSTARIWAQGVELYGGYPISIKSGNKSQTVSNWNNGQAGLNFTAYIRSVAIQFGVGYTSNNYTVYENGSRGTVFHQYLTVPIMVYPRLATDGKNTYSLGVGCRAKFAVGEMRASLVYANGKQAEAFKGGYKPSFLPRISLRYTRLLGQSFLLFTDVFSEFDVMQNFDDGGTGGHPPPWAKVSVTVPHYYSLVTLGVNVGIGYLVPIDGNKTPRYYQRRPAKQTQ